MGNGDTPQGDTPQILQGIMDAIPHAEPTAPAVQVPYRPSDQAPDVGFEQTPMEQKGGTLPLDPIHTMAMAFMGSAAENQKQYEAEAAGQPAGAPGSFRSKLAGALNAAGAGLGDAAAAQGGPNDRYSGWLGAVGRVLNARTQRKTEEQKTAFEQSERLKNDQINLAVANANLRQHALTVHKMEKEDRDSDAAAGELFMSHLRAGSELSKGQKDSFNVQDNISNDQLKQMMQKDPNFAATHTARITGYEKVLNADGTTKKDANGFDVETPLYSVADIAVGDKSKTITVTPELAKKWNEGGVKQVAPGTVLPATVANQMDIQAQRYGTTLSILNHDKVVPLPDEVKDQMVTALNDPMVQHAIAMQPGSPLAGLYEAAANMQEHIKAAQAQLAIATKAGNQDAIAKLTQDIQSHQDIAQKLDKTIDMGFTPAERSAYQKQMEADRKQTEIENQNAKRDAETARHNRAEEDIKRLDVSGGAPEVVADVGGKLADAEMVPSQLPKRAKNYDATWLAADKASWGTYGKPYDGAQAEAEYKYASNSQNQNVLKLINGVVDKNGSLDIAAKAAAGLPGMNQQTLNKVFNLAGGEFGNKSITDFHTAMLGLADEYSKIMGGGTATDTGRQQALDILKDAYSKGQMAGAIAIVKKDIAARQNAIIGKNRFLQKQYYGSNGMTVTMVSPDGKSYKEVPRSEAQARLAQGARIANKQDYANLNITSTDH